MSDEWVQHKVDALEEKLELLNGRVEWLEVQHARALVGRRVRAQIVYRSWPKWVTDPGGEGVVSRNEGGKLHITLDDGGECVREVYEVEVL